jgi:protein TonB
MDNFSNFAYKQRDPISIGAAALMAAGLIMTFYFHISPKLTLVEDTDFIAMLDTPTLAPMQTVKEPVKKEVTPPNKTEKKEITVANVTPLTPKKIQVEKIQEQPSENIASPISTQSNTVKSESSNNSSSKSTESSKSVDAPSQPNKSVSENRTAAIKYETYVLAYLEKNKKYPTDRQARESRPEGTVKVYLELNRLGQVHGFGILQSSGSNLLDAEAIKVIKFASLPPFPEDSFIGESTHRFVANLKYSIVNNGYLASNSESN